MTKGWCLKTFPNVWIGRAEKWTGAVVGIGLGEREGNDCEESRAGPSRGSG